MNEMGQGREKGKDTPSGKMDQLQQLLKSVNERELDLILRFTRALLKK